MTLNNEEYRIEGEGVWISKDALEKWREHYCKNSDGHKRDWLKDKDKFRFPFYMGKADVLTDILKHFEELMG